MANLKDLIVNGPSRFLGKIYGKITNAELADMARIEGDMVDATVVSGTTLKSADNRAVFTYVMDYNIGGITHKMYNLEIDANITKIICNPNYFIGIGTITAKNGSFVNGQRLSLYGKVKLDKDILGGTWKGSFSEFGVAPYSKGITTGQAGGNEAEFYVACHPEWHDFVYWGGKWYGTTYINTYANNQIVTNDRAPVSSAAVINYFTTHLTGSFYTYEGTLTANTTEDVPDNTTAIWAEPKGAYSLTVRLPENSKWGPIMYVHIKPISSGGKVYLKSYNGNYIGESTSYMGAGKYYLLRKIKENAFIVEDLASSTPTIYT